MITQNKIGDFLTKIKNAQKIHKTICVLQKSKMVLGTLNILYKEGFINGYSVEDKRIIVFLKYKINGEPAIQKITIISKSGVPKYISIEKLKMLIKSNKNFGTLIVSTPAGILSQKDAIITNNGGQLLCQIF